MILDIRKIKTNFQPKHNTHGLESNCQCDPCFPLNFRKIGFYWLHFYQDYDLLITNQNPPSIPFYSIWGKFFSSHLQNILNTSCKPALKISETHGEEYKNGYISLDTKVSQLLSLCWEKMPDAHKFR